MAVRECDNLTADLSAFLDGELTEERARLIAGHLRTCDGCRRASEELRAVSAALAQLPRQRAPAETLAVVRRAMGDGATIAATASVQPFRMRRLFGSGALAAMIGLAALAGWYGLMRRTPESPTPRAPLRYKNWTSPGTEIVRGAPRVEETGPSAVAAPIGGETGATGRDQQSTFLRTDEGGAVSTHVVQAPLEPSAGVIAAAAPPSPRAGNAEGAILRREFDTLADRLAAGERETLVEVTIAPRDVAEYVAVRRIAMTKAFVGDRETMANVPGAAGAAGETLVLDLPTESIGGLIAALSKQAPERVQVAMQFPAAELSEVQRSLGTDAASAAAGFLAEAVEPSSPTPDVVRTDADTAMDEREQRTAASATAADAKQRDAAEGPRGRTAGRASGATLKSAAGAPPSKKDASDAAQPAAPGSDGRLRSPTAAPAAPVPSPSPSARPAAQPADPGEKERSAPASPGLSGGGRGFAANERDAASPASPEAEQPESGKPEAKLEAYRQAPQGLGVEPADDAAARTQNGFAGGRSEDADGAAYGYVADGVARMGRAVVRLGQSLLHFGTVHAAREMHGQDEAPATRVRVVILPPADAAASRPATRTSP